MHQAISDQLMGFGCEEEEVELLVNLAKQILQRETEWTDEAGPAAWRQVALPSDPSTGAPRDLFEHRSELRKALAEGDVTGAERKRVLFTLFAAAAAAVSGKAQALRVLSFGEGMKFDFVFRGGVKTKGAIALFRQRRVEGEDTAPGGGASHVYVAARREGDLAETEVARKAPELFAA